MTPDPLIQADPDRIPGRLAFWLAALAAVEIGRGVVAASHGLYGVEAYYWMYSFHLSLGYFDHPPMLGWMIHLFDWFGPPSSLAARMHAVVSHFLTCLMLYALGRNLFGSRRIGLRTAVLYSVIPIFSIAAVQNEPDVPLMLFWVATLVCFERSLATGKGLWWLGAGVCAGGTLLSKFHAIPMLGLLFLYLVFSRRDRRALAGPWPWIAAAVALVMFSPNIYWNATHDWATFRFQLLGRVSGGGFRPEYAAMTAFAPFAYLSPVAYVAILMAMVFVARGRAPEGERGWALMWWASAPLFFFFLLLSCARPVKFHWPAVSFVAGIPLLAAYLERCGRRSRRWLYGVAASVSLAGYLFLVYPYPFSLSLPHSLIPPPWRLKDFNVLEEDYANHLSGLREMGEAVGEEYDKLAAQGPALILSRRFDWASLAGFYSGRPEAAWVPFADDYDPRGYLYWPQPAARPGAGGVYVLTRPYPRDQAEELKKLRRVFGSVEEASPVEVYHGSTLFRIFNLAACHDLREVKRPEEFPTDSF